jgi:WD40 repeat protein
LVASGGDDGTILLWEAATGRFVSSIDEDAEPIREVCFHPQRDLVAARNASGTVHVWKLERSSRDGELEVVPSLLWTGSATAIAFGPEGARLLAAQADGSIRLVEVESGRVEGILPASAGAGQIRILAAMPEVTLAVSGSDDGKVQLWDLQRKSPVSEWRFGHAPIRALALSRDGLLAVSSDRLSIWDTTRGEQLLDLEWHTRPINTLAFSPDGRFLASGSEDQSAVVWDLEAHRKDLAAVGLGW